MIKLSQAVIVEGKYDKIKLSSILDALIIPTDGFGIFKNSEKLTLIRRLADTRGIIIMTDSDAAGFKIRAFISGTVDKNRIKHVYIPDVLGKEKRKSEPSKEGKLGVEGIEVNVIIDALKKSGIQAEKSIKQSADVRQVTNADLYEDGLSGRAESSVKRRRFLKESGLPERMTTSSMRDIINIMFTFEEYKRHVGKINELTEAMNGQKA